MPCYNVRLQIIACNSSELNNDVKLSERNVSRIFVKTHVDIGYYKRHRNINECSWYHLIAEATFELVMRVLVMVLVM